MNSLNPHPNARPEDATFWRNRCRAAEQLIGAMKACMDPLMLVPQDREFILAREREWERKKMRR